MYSCHITVCSEFGIHILSDWQRKVMGLWLQCRRIGDIRGCSRHSRRKLSHRKLRLVLVIFVRYADIVLGWCIDGIMHSLNGDKVWGLRIRFCGWVYDVGSMLRIVQHWWALIGLRFGVLCHASRHWLVRTVHISHLSYTPLIFTPPTPLTLHKRLIPFHIPHRWYPRFKRYKLIDFLMVIFQPIVDLVSCNPLLY
jgi:hypothetical protein